MVTNDDGITSPGIRTLIEAVGTLGKVVVVAPDSPQSGKGHAITLGFPLRLNQVDIFGDIEAWTCSGTPVDCVKLARDKILDRAPDICVSGINHGANHSINIIYSGTMSAAMELPKHTLFNVNIPDVDAKDYKGIRITRQANAKWVEEFDERRDPHGKKYYWLTGEFKNQDAGNDTDVWALENGYTSLVPVQFDLTDYRLMKKLEADWRF